MQGEDGERAPRIFPDQSEVVANLRLLRDGQEVTQRIDHDVADKVDASARTPFLEQVLDGVLFGNEEKVGDSIGEDAVDFLRHGAIEATQAGFDMGHGNAEFGSGQRNGYRRIHVSYDQNGSAQIARYRCR